ncbi:unnamed protein product [Paramecium octaurelia]|uniref:Uncharacterized protein n=1 Tax=Paramecium octaurelia TaxID=43137 RepID=A0A8S1V7G6_PAROT|nr:unnamed protein product [Paramecium octaurelia]
MFNQLNWREKHAIETLLSLHEESQNEVDYDKEMQRLFKPQENALSHNNSYIVQKPRSQLLKIICPKSNSNQHFEFRGRSLEKQSERIIVPDQYRPKYLLQQLKTQRNLRHVSEYRTINVPTIQIVQSLQTINLIERTGITQQKKLRKKDVQVPRFILKSRQKL